MHLHDSFRECLRGSGRAVVVSGAVGTGKTALLDEFSTWGAEQGAVVLSATGSQTEMALPLGLVTQLARQVVRSTRMEQEIRRLLDDENLSAFTGDPLSNSATRAIAPVLQEISLLLLEVAQYTPVLIAIDDIQYADLPSLYCLSHLIRRMRSTPIMVVLNVCTDRSSGRLPRLLHTEVLRQAHSRHLRLDPLTGDGVRELLEQRPVPLAGPDLPRDVLAASAGNPLLARAFIEDSETAEGSGEQLIGGDAVDQAVLTCLYRLEPQLSTLAEAVAVLGPDATATTAGRMLGIKSETLNGYLGVLEQVGLFRGLQYRHPRMAAAVLQQITAADRAALHAHAARVLHSDDAAATTVARHVMAASQIDAPWLIEVMLAAAESALDRGEPGPALDLLDRLGEYPLDRRQRALTRAIGTRIEWWVNPATATRQLDDLVMAARDGLLPGRHVVALTSQLLWQGRYGEAETVMASFDGEGLDDGELIHHLLILQVSLHYGFPQLLRSFPQLDPIVMCPDRTPDLDAAHGAEFFRHARANEKTLSLALAMLGAVMHAGNLDDVAGETGGMQALVAESSPTGRALIAALNGEIALRRGDPEGAVRHCREALRILPPLGWGVFVGQPLSTLIRAAADLGRLELAAQYLSVPAPPEMLASVTGVRYLYARGRYYLLAGRVHQALVDFLACRDLTSGWPSGIAAVVPWWLDAAQACELLGRREQAGELLRTGLDQPAIETCGHRGLRLSDVPATSSDPSPRRRPPAARHGEDTLLGELSDAERKVASLASKGCTNREIAETLYVTMSTVEQHLTRVYKKLNLSGRNDLRSKLGSAVPQCA
jgi:DNA-binding CsgD family transcriptional regulator